MAEELHEPIIRKFEKWKLHSSFIDITWNSDLADMRLLSKFNKGIRFLFVLLIFIVSMPRNNSLKDKESITITNALPKILDESRSKPNKIWVDKGSEFYKKSMKSYLEKML